MLRAFLIAVVLTAVVAAPAQAQTVTIRYPSYPDFTDPQMSYTVAGWQIMRLTHMGLLTYAPGQGPEALQLVPGLAEALPAVSPDGLTYTFQLRRGLRYSNGQRVRASDFEYAIKRMLKLESGGSPFYTSTIAGAEQYVARGGDISGISTSGRTITVRLVGPNAQFPYIVAMPFAALVPSTTPMRVLTRRGPAGVGPMRFASIRAPRRIVLRRNPRFRLPGFRRSSVSQVRIVANARRFDYEDDASAPRPPRTRSVETSSTYYFFLNHRTPPFDRKEVRQAVHYAIDKRALVRLFGGLLKPGCTFIPPLLLPERAAEPCPYGDPNAAPQVEKAKQMIRDAGVAGQPVTVWGNSEEQTKAVTEYLAQVLREIGLNATPRIVDGEVYFQTIGDQRTRAQIGFGNWFQDYPHPDNFFFLVDPDTIQERNNQNFGNVDDPRIKAELDRLKPLPLAEAASAYAALDRLLVDEAHIVPYGYRLLPLNWSARVRPECVQYHPVLALDFSQLCVA